jgi:hypothetical protein
MLMVDVQQVILNLDGIAVWVLKERGRKNTRELRLDRGGLSGISGVLFRYSISRSGKFAEELACYLFRLPANRWQRGIIHVEWLAYVRCKFKECLRGGTKKSGTAQEGGLFHRSTLWVGKQVRKASL